MLQIFVTNHIRIRGPNTPLRAAITKALTLDNPAFVERKKRRQPTYGLDPRIQLYVFDRGDIIIPRGFLEELYAILATHGIDASKVITIRQTKVDPISFGPWNEKYVLKEDQVPAVEAATQRNGTVVAPAGSGKTVIGLNYVYRMAQPALWLTHTTDLLYQTVERAYDALEGVGKIGILGDGKQDWGSGKLIVATVQTLQANPHLVDALNPLIGTVVVDEAHHFPAPAFIEVAGKFAAANMIGLTATPDRKDRLEVYMYRGIGPAVYEIKRDGLYDSGRLIKPEVRFVYTSFDYEQASDRNEIDAVDAGGEELNYRELLDELIYDEGRAKLVAETILEAAPKNYSIVLSESVRYCYIVRDWVERFAKARWGVVPRIEVVHGPLQQYTWQRAHNEIHARKVIQAGNGVDLRQNARTNIWEVKVPKYTPAEMKEWQVTDSMRRDIMERASRKEIDILFATQLAREGLDMPHLTVGHMIMPKRGDASDSKNGAAVEQEIGRIMRPDPANPNKKAIWFDYVDYDVGVFQSQYYSRRSVYKRLGLVVPKKPKTEREAIDEFLATMPW